ncbi:hypothetical protein PG985_001524 [Apiospora marii]|uniref:Uncharacterized protein n=1 Tax=Apiospora marii TaxID=335849 RepID=A0ABR1RI80_9PEZI
MERRDIDGEWESVIGPMPIDHPIGKVAYDRWGISIYEHTYDGLVATRLPRPALTKTGRVAKKQSKKPQKQPHAYWKAQCAFRGLSPKGSIVQLQERLEGHEFDPMLEEFKALEAKAMTEFTAKNDQAVEDMWIREMTDEQKMATDLRRYLVETFPAGATSPEAVVVQGTRSSGHSWARGVQNLARDLGLEARIVEVTPDPDEPFEVADRRWVVVGPKKPGVVRATRPVLQTTEKRQVEKHQRQDAEMAREEARAAEQQQELRAALDKCEDWDVTGTYKISCPHIEEEWSNLTEGQDLTIAVYRERTPKGIQMYAKFDFIVAAGVFRFERHRKDTKVSAPSRDDTKKRKREQNSEDGEESEVEEENSEDGSIEEEELEVSDEPSRSPTPEAFYFGSIPLPSAECRTWNYRWRGNDMGTNEIHLYSDQRLFEVKWYGPRAEKLKGTFGGDFVKDCTFTGVKIGVGADLEDINIAEEWTDRNEHAHYLASRW